MEKEHKWVMCPRCGAKTRLQLVSDTELYAFPLFCPKCKQETMIDAKHFNIEITKQ